MTGPTPNSTWVPLEDLAKLGETDRALAERAYESVIEHRDESEWQVANALYSLGRMYRLASQLTPDEALEEDAEAAAEREKESQELLRRARDRLEAAHALSGSEHDPIRRGRLLYELTDVIAELGEHDRAIEMGREALALLLDQFPS